MDKKFRLSGDLPKVGIRPVIDGRRKVVRESLEYQTLGMSKRVAAFIEGSSCHESGEASVCGIAYKIR